MQVQIPPPSLPPLTPAMWSGCRWIISKTKARQLPNSTGNPLAAQPTKSSPAAPCSCRRRQPVAAWWSPPAAKQRAQASPSTPTNRPPAISTSTWALAPPTALPPSTAAMLSETPIVKALVISAVTTMPSIPIALPPPASLGPIHKVFPPGRQIVVIPLICTTRSLAIHGPRPTRPSR